MLVPCPRLLPTVAPSPPLATFFSGESALIPPRGADGVELRFRPTVPMAALRSSAPGKVPRLPTDGALEAESRHARQERQRRARVCDM